MIARSRVSTLMASDEGACSASGESMLKVTPARDNRVSDLGISCLSFAIAHLGVSFSKAVIRKAGPETENSFADTEVEFVCPNEFTQQGTSKKKNILFIWQNSQYAFDLVGAECNATSWRASTSDNLFRSAFKV